MADDKAIAKEIRASIKTAKKEDQESIEELIDESQLSASAKEKLHSELQVRLNELEQDVIDQTVAEGKKDEAKALINREQEEINKKEDMDKLPVQAAEIPKNIKAVKATEEEVMKYQTEGKLFGWDPKTRIAKILASVLVLAMCFIPASFAADTTDEAVLGNNRWSVQNDGDLVPNANTYSIGSATQYPASIWVNGAEYSSFAAGTDGNWTDTGLTTTLDQAPTKFIATHSSGKFQATQLAAGTSGILGVTNGQTLTLETNNAFIFGDNSDTATMTFTGDDVSLDTSDGGFIFALTDATDGTLDIQTQGDTNDYISFTTVANVPTIVTVGTCNLEIAPDGGTTTVTGALTATGLATAAGLTTSSTVTLQNSETIANATNQTVRVSSNAASPILEVYDPGTSDTDAILKLTADAGGDAADTWQIISDGATNALLFDNAGATVFSIPSTGIIALSAALDLSNGEQLSNATDDTVRIASDDASMVFDVYSPLATNGTSAINLIGDAGADATDRFQIKNNANGTLTFANDSAVAGTYVTKLTMSSAGVLTLVSGATITPASDVVTFEENDAAGSFIFAGADTAASSITVASDSNDDAADAFKLSMDAADLMTITTGATTAATVSTAGLWTFPAGATSSLVTDASSLTTGSLITAGGLAVAKQLYLGDDIDMSVNGTGVYDITLKDNVADALSIVRGTTDMMVFDTTSASPLITITPATTITGALTFNSTLLANGRVGGASTMSSSSTFLSTAGISYAVIQKRIGYSGVDDAGSGSILPAGTAGQELAINITAVESGGTWKLTTYASSTFTRITFDTVGDNVLLQYVTGPGWIVKSNQGATVTVNQLP